MDGVVVGLDGGGMGADWSSQKYLSMAGAARQADFHPLFTSKKANRRPG
jgi:hypothetical protein